MNKLSSSLLAIILSATAANTLHAQEYTTNRLPADSISPATDYTTPSPSHDLLKNSFFATGGYSLIVSSMEGGWPSGNPKLGLDWQVGFDHILNEKGIGWGILYSGYHSSYSESSYSGHITLHYLAPQLVCQTLRTDSRWNFGFKAGLGLFTWVERETAMSHLLVSERSLGFGVNYMVFLDLRLDRDWSIIADLSGVTGLFKQKSYADADALSRVTRVSLNLGIKFRF